MIDVGVIMASCDDDAGDDIMTARREDTVLVLWSVEKAESDESVATEADVSLLSSMHSSDDVDMLADAHLDDDAHLADDAQLTHGLGDAGHYC